jgi:hypothetical protein
MTAFEAETSQRRPLVERVLDRVLPRLKARPTHSEIFEWVCQDVRGPAVDHFGHNGYVLHYSVSDYRARGDSNRMPILAPAAFEELKESTADSRPFVRHVRSWIVTATPKS